MRNKRSMVFVLLMACLILTWKGMASSTEEDSTITTKLHGFASFEAGEIMKGVSEGYAGATAEVDHGWVQKAEFGLYADARINERLHIIIGPEGTLTRSFKTYPGSTLNDQYIEDLKPKFTFTLGKAEGLYTLGDPDQALFELEGGYFTYKYDQDARNFGEYLFRATPYPTCFFNKFDRPFAYLLGFRAGNTLWNNFHHDLFLTSEMTEYMGSLGDFSLSYLAEYKMPGFFTTNSWLTVGGGISLYRIFSINGKNTSPGSTKSLLRLDNVQWTYNPPPFDNVSATGDSVYQSFAGTKLMGRLSFDLASLIKPFTGDLWKSGDIVLYSELAILGVKNYTAYNYDKGFGDTSRVAVVDTTRTFYNKLKERMPLMVGFTFRIPYDILTDVVNCELEYLDSRYTNNFEGAFRWEPIPTNDVEHEKLKWSFYAKKCLGPHASIIGQIANDHFVPTSHVNLQGGQGVQDFQDVTLRHGNWWWVLKVKFNY